MEIPQAFFLLLGFAAMIAAAGWALPRIVRALSEMPAKPDPLNIVLENLSKPPLWQIGPPDKKGPP